MSLLTTEKLKVSGLYMPRNLNEKLYTHKKRTIWTPDGEYQIPVKKKKKTGLMKGIVSNIWFKDEKGKPLLIDPTGEANTITNGAIYEMMQMLWGYGFGTSYTNQLTSNASSVNAPYSQATSSYNDGTYNFPRIAVINAIYSGSTTFWDSADGARPWKSLFGQVYFINGSSAGLTGCATPAGITAGTGFASQNDNTGQWSAGQGWYNSKPTVAIGNTNTTLSDSFSATNSGTPQMSHSMTLTATSSARSFTFDGIVWVPIIGYSNASGAFYSSGSRYEGNTAITTPPTWASASSTPTTMNNIIVSALWNPGYAITLNPGGSWGFTYTFQG